MGDAYIGLDIGTSAVKGVLIDDEQSLLASGEAALTTSHPRALWSEQEPDDWLSAAEGVLASLRTQASGAFSGVCAIGLSGQMHGAVCLDATDRPVRPAILWNDGRSSAECEEIEASGVDVGRLAGIIPMPGFTSPKLRWMRTHESDAFARVRTVLLPKDYVRLWLTGERVTDMSDAAGTLWLDQAERAWSADLLSASGATVDMMPRLIEGNEIGGQLRPEIADRLGLPPGVVVAGGGGDAAAGAVGIGAVSEGDAFISLGTSGQYFVSTRMYTPSPETLVHTFAHCVPRMWFQMACMLNGASCLAWVASVLGETDIEHAVSRCEQDYAGPGELMFLPYLTGERTPHNNPHARGVFFGLGPRSDANALVQAVLEGVAFSFLDAQACLARAGSSPSQVAAIGGGTRSAFWMQMFANVLGIRVGKLPGGENGPAFGAARLGMMAQRGVSPSEICKRVEPARVYEPDATLTAHYRARFERFQRLYALLADEFRVQ